MGPTALKRLHKEMTPWNQKNQMTDEMVKTKQPSTIHHWYFGSNKCVHKLCVHINYCSLLVIIFLQMCMASYLLHSNNKLHTLFQQLSIKYFKINIIILLSSLILKYKKNLDVT